MATQPDSGRTTEQIVSQFLSKALHAILSARIPHLHTPSTSARQPFRKRDRWFHLALGDLDTLLPHGMVTEPLIVDVILSPRDDPTMPEAIIERWVAQCEIPPPWSPFHSSGETLVKRTYKKSIILLRSIYSVLRLLPAHGIFKMLRTSNHSYNYDLTYRISSYAEPFSRKEESELKSHHFAPVETQYGQLLVSVQYLKTLSHFNLEISSLLPPMLINNYVGSPAADPLRDFHLRPSSSAPASAPSFHRQNSFETPPNRLLPPQNRKSAFSFDEFKLSPPIYMSPTPSPPTFTTSSYMQSRLRGETAPVSIPQTGPNWTRPVRSPNFLPPPSPRSVRGLDPSGQESPEGSRSFRKSEGLKISDVYAASAGITTPRGLVKDGRDDSGRFSAGLSSDSPRFGFSRSSSRLSDTDDADFSYPFAVDDVDTTSDSPIRSNEELGHATSSFQKSQEAEVGALVHMLKNASPLRETDNNSSQTSKSEINFNQDNLGSGSSFFMSRKASDALDELQSYKEIKEMLIRQSQMKIHD